MEEEGRVKEKKKVLRGAGFMSGDYMRGDCMRSESEKEEEDEGLVSDGERGGGKEEER